MDGSDERKPAQLLFPGLACYSALVLYERQAWPPCGLWRSFWWILGSGASAVWGCGLCPIGKNLYCMNRTPALFLDVKMFRDFANGDGLIKKA